MKRQVKIGRRKYKIRYVSEIYKKKKSKGRYTIGMIMPAKKTIIIKRMGKNIDKQTLFHELAHGIAIELVEATYRGFQKSKIKKEKKEFLRYNKNFIRLNNDEGFIEFFGGLLNRTFKLK